MLDDVCPRIGVGLGAEQFAKSAREENNILARGIKHAAGQD